ncbi:Aur protein kinase [Plasmodium fragile]|uniref:Aur protein kinase n=1 Tax=Plasmodium fragile TaxID=5857 RepID=A0A0D9QRJ2_PLAFR|nr:Aur protein kinase [Plasmodium fragile]KJP89705.1 Aur protein kinase [Plasmodium fragile]
MNKHKATNDHVRTNTKSCPHDNGDATDRRSRNTKNEQPHQPDKSNNARRINSAHAVMHTSTPVSMNNPQSEKGDNPTKRANIISVQRQLHNIFSKSENEKRDVRRGLVRTGDYYPQGNNTTQVHCTDTCEGKFRAENRLHCSGRKTDQSSTIRTQLTQKRDVLVRSKRTNNNSWDSACKRKVDWDDAVENKKRKPPHSYDKSGHSASSAISCTSVGDGKAQSRGQDEEHVRRSATGDDTHAAYVDSVGRSMGICELRRRGELGGGDPGIRPCGEGHEKMKPCVRGETSEGTSQAMDETRGESSPFALTPSDKLEDVPLNGGSRREKHHVKVHMKTKEHSTPASNIPVVSDDGDSTVEVIQKGGPPRREEIAGPIKCHEQCVRQEKNVCTVQADQQEVPLHKDTYIGATRKGSVKDKCMHSTDVSSFLFQRGGLHKERKDEIAVEVVSRWKPHSSKHDKWDDTDNALPVHAQMEKGKKKGLHGTYLFTQIKKAYEERVSVGLQTNRPTKKTPEHEEKKNVLSHGCKQRGGELCTHNFSHDDQVEKELRRTHTSGESVKDTFLHEHMIKTRVAVHEGDAPPASDVTVVGPSSKTQREEAAPPPNRRFAAHTRSSNSKSIKTIKGGFTEGQKKGTSASQKASVVPRGIATQLTKTNNKGIVQHESERKNIIFSSGKGDKDKSRATFTRVVSRREDGADAPGGADTVETPCSNLLTPTAWPKKEKEKSHKIPPMKKTYGPFRSNRGVGPFVMGRMNSHPGGPHGKERGKEHPNEEEEATNPMSEMTNTNLVMGDGERIKRHNGLGGNKGSNSRNEPPSRGLQAKTTDPATKRNPPQQHSSISSSNYNHNNNTGYSSRSAKTPRALPSSTSNSSFRVSKVCPSERGNKTITHLYIQGSRNVRAKEEGKGGTTKRNNESQHSSSSTASTRMRSANVAGSNVQLCRKRPLVPISKCRGNTHGKSANQTDATKTGSSYIVASRRNVQETCVQDESPRCNLTHLSNSKKAIKNSHLHYKDPISEEMEKHKRDQKKKKNVKSNSIPAGNVNKGRKSSNSKNIFLGAQDKCGGEGQYGAGTCRKRSDSYDERGKQHPKGGGSSSGKVGPSHDDEGRESCFAKETLSDNACRNESSSSASQRERKEVSYFEWLAREKKKKEEGVGTGEGAVIGDGASAQGGSAETEATACEVSEKNLLSDVLYEEQYHLMLQPLSAFNLKQNERNFEQEDFIVDKNPIGNGRTGLVFKAIIKKENEDVALKVMAKDTIASLNIERQVLKEIIIQASLNHINILQLIAYFEDRTRLFLILELANGGSIRNKMKADAQPLLEEQVALYVYQIADALAYLHKFNIIHRDLKPDNILLHHSDVHKGNHIYKYGVVKIADFGFSCQMKNKRQKRSTFCGTVDYMPPEIINQIPYDCNVDLWCLGIVIFELLVGFPPFTDDTQVGESGKSVHY